MPKRKARRMLIKPRDDDDNLSVDEDDALEIEDGGGDDESGDEGGDEDNGDDAEAFKLISSLFFETYVLSNSKWD